MANTDRPNGFRPAKSLLGTDWNALVRYHEAADRTADTTNRHGDIYIGDPVRIVSGKVQVANFGEKVDGVCVAAGFDNAKVTSGDPGYFNPSALDRRHAPLESAKYTIGVCPAEGVLFEVQSASDLDLVIGSKADTTVAANTAHGNTKTGQSSAEITTASWGSVEVVEHVKSPDNDRSLTNARYLVKFITPVDPN